MRWLLWPGFFLIHIYGDVQYFTTTSSRCGVAVPASKSAAEQTGEDVTGPGHNAMLITVSAKKPANSSEASPDQSTSSCWLCYSCTHSKHRMGFICTGRWKERKQKDKKQKWKMTVSQKKGNSDTHTLEQSFFWHAPNQKQIFMQDRYRPHLKICCNFFPKIIITIIIFTSYNFICVTWLSMPYQWGPPHSLRTTAL